jgi:hypothetical protein
VVRAILLDPEAAQRGRRGRPNFGKVREPVMRMTNWAARSARPRQRRLADPSTSANTSLGQSALTAPSVFNFFRPATRRRTPGSATPACWRPSSRSSMR